MSSFSPFDETSPAAHPAAPSDSGGGSVGTTLADACAVVQMLKIGRTGNAEVVLTVSGCLQASNLDELSALLGAERGQPGLALDLKDLLLVDGDAIRFLCACEGEGVVLRHCPRYISAWMTRERDRP
jgi:hypothetical protein